MFIQPIDYFLAVWFALAVLCALYVAVDMYRNTPEPAVMKWGFILVTLYMGPIGLLLYVLACKEPRPGTHEAFVEPLWKQGIGSTIHCVAGDATGIILAATITALLGLPMAVDVVVEYIAGFAFGLFIFQALFMKNMMGGTYWENVRATFFPELISMNAVMAGMVPVMMMLMMGRDMRAMEPTELMFWGVMSLGVIVGFAVAFPFNVLMVDKGLKHGMMTLREPGGRFDVPLRAVPENDQGHGAHGGGHEGHASGSNGHKSESGKNGDMGILGTKDPRQEPAHAPTYAQIGALTGVTTVFLLIGAVVPAFHVNVWLSADDVGGLIMPPGMIMDFDTPADAMHDMAAVHPRAISYRAPADARGDTVLEPRIEDGVKVFDLTASVIRWNILPDETVAAYAYNRQLPGPRLELTEGDRVRINFRNELPEPSTVHWHGLILPNEMDGPAEVTQAPVPTGGSYVYEYTVEQSGTYFYHSHTSSDRQQGLGLYGAMIISPRDPAEEPAADIEYTIQLQEWLKREWLTYPAMTMEGAMPNFFTINGKSYPATDVIRMKVGETLKLRLVGSNNNFVHPMHVHGGPFQVVAIDGETLEPGARYLADTVNVSPGKRFDVIWPALKPGKWLIHCHIPHHITNNNVEVQGGGGLTMVIEVTA